MDEMGEQGSVAAFPVTCLLFLHHEEHRNLLAAPNWEAWRATRGAEAESELVAVG